MRKTIFDLLMISDSERSHTQTIGWILSLYNDQFPSKLSFHCNTKKLEIYELF